MPWNKGVPRSLRDRQNISDSLKRRYSGYTPCIRTRLKTWYKEPYNYERKLGKLTRYMEDSAFPEKNKTEIMEYKRLLSITTGAGYVYNTIRTLFKEFEGREMPKTFKEMGEPEWLDIYRKVMTGEQSQRTKADRINRIKAFIVWLNQDNKPRFLEKMKVKVRRRAEKYVSEGDIRRFLRACESDEEKAFFATLWEGGFAVCELLKVRRRDITIRQDVMEIYVESKNRNRVTPILRQKGRMFPLGAYKLLLKHLKRTGKDPEQRIWTMEAYNQAQYRCKKIKRKVGLYHIRTHSFRKSRATYNDENGMSYASNCIFGGWEIGSRTLQNYILTTGRTLIPTLRKLNENN